VNHPSSDADPLLPPPSAQFAGDSPEEAAPQPMLQDANESSDSYTCPRCSARLPLIDQAEHEDFHFAQDLQNEQTTPPRAPPPSTTKSSATSSVRGGGSARGRGRGRGRPSAMSSGPERGQKRLHF
jgi:DNA polymerase eta